ncbi:MAG: deoxyribodipyrimidine photo-lyase [Bacteroidetes bacterium]|nr:MAG: deoxyribodipyrimidine photo-lyase [Bacteroidota bacterium]
MERIDALFWHRRDLRIEDNTGLFQALKDSQSVLPVFVFDRNILDQLDKNDRRVSYIHREVNQLKREYQEAGSDLMVLEGDPGQLIPELAARFQVDAVFTNRDYEPQAKKRDSKVRDQLNKSGIAFRDYKDQVIFEFDEVKKQDGSPYTVFTPYSNKWLQQLEETLIETYELRAFSKNLYQGEEEFPFPELNSLGFQETKFSFPHKSLSRQKLQQYDQTRDFPAKEGTSRLGLHLRFGTISIRKLVRHAQQWNQVFLKELIWRDFYQMILDCFPESVEHAFRSKYDLIRWENNEEHFQKWCEGKTGYPLVDAGMRELNETGYMHNRVRMVVASFLCKHLLIDWKWGERYFAAHLLDFELASNVGGWQWAAGTGCDAAPYFRVFNPMAQQQKFDRDFQYIQKWIPEWGTPEYPEPIVVHEFARKRALDRYKEALDQVAT